VSFHTFTLPEDCFVRLLVKNLGRGMPERVVRKELEALDMHVQAVMQLRSVRRNQEPTKDRPLTPHFIVSVARGPEVSKVRSITELYGLRVSVGSYVAPNVPCNANAASASDTRSVTADTRPCASRVEAPTSPVGAQPRGNSLSAVAVGVTTEPVTGAVLNGRKRTQLLQSERQKVSGRAPPQANPLPLKPSGPDPLRSRRIWATAGTTSSEGGVLSKPPPLQHHIRNLLLSRSRRLPRSLK